MADRRGRRLRKLVLVMLILGACAGIFWLSLPSMILGVLRKAVNGTVKAGRVNVSLGSVRIKDLEVTTDKGEPFLSVPSLDISFDVGSLLRTRDAQSSITSVTIEGPTVHLVRRAGEPWNAEGILKAQPPYAAPAEVRYFTGRLAVRRGTVIVKDAELSIPDLTFAGLSLDGDFSTGTSASVSMECTSRPAGKISFAGTVGTREPLLRGRLKLEAVDPAALVNLAGARDIRIASGKASASLDFRCEKSWDNLDWFGRIEVPSFSAKIKGRPFAVAGPPCRLTLARDSLALEKTNITVGKVPVTLSGQIFNFRSPQLALTATVEKGSLLDVKGLLDKPPPSFPSGAFSAFLRVRGAPAEPSVDGSLSSPRMNMAGETLSDVSLNFVYINDALRIKNLSALTRAGRVSGRGWVLTGTRNRILLDVRTAATSLAALLGGQVRGSADGSLSVVGDMQSPLVRGYASIPSFAASGVDLGRGSVGFLMDPSHLFIRNAHFRKGSATITARGAADLKSKQLDLSIVGRGVPIPALKVPSLGNLGGVLDVHGALGGKLDDIKARGVVTGGRISAGALTLGSPTGIFSLAGNEAVVESGRILVSGSPLTFQGFVDLRNPLRFGVFASADNIPLDGVTLPGIASVAGRAGGQVVVRGEGTARSIRASGFLRSPKGLRIETSSESPLGRSRADARFGISFSGPAISPSYTGWVNVRDVALRGRKVPGIGVVDGALRVRGWLDGKGTNPYVSLRVGSGNLSVKGSASSPLGAFTGRVDMLDGAVVGPVSNPRWFGSALGTINVPETQMGEGISAGGSGPFAAFLDGSGVAKPSLAARISSDSLLLSCNAREGSVRGGFAGDVAFRAASGNISFRGWLEGRDAEVPSASLPGVGRVSGKGSPLVFFEGGTRSDLWANVLARDFKLHGTSPAFDLDGAFNGELALEGPLSKMRYAGRLTGRDVVFSRLAVPEAGPARAHGSFDISLGGSTDGEVFIKGIINADSFDLPDLALPDIGVFSGEGKAAGVEVSGPLSSLCFKGTIEGDRVSYALFPREGVDRLQGSAKGIFDFSGGIDSMSYRGTVTSDTTAFAVGNFREIARARGKARAQMQVSGTMADVEFGGNILGALDHLETISLPGVGAVKGRNGDFDFRVSGTPDSSHFSGKVSGKGFSFESEQFPDWGCAEGLIDFDLSLRQAGSDVELGGEIIGRGFTMPERVLPTMGALNESVDFEAVLKGTASNPVVEGSLTGGWGSLGRIRVENPRGRFSLNRDRKDELLIEDLALQYGSSSLAVRGALNIRTQFMELALESPDIDLGKVKGELPFTIPLRIAGPAALKAGIVGDPEVGFFIDASSKGPQGEVSGTMYLPSGPEERYMAHIAAKGADAGTLPPADLDTLHPAGKADAEASLSFEGGKLDISYLFTMREGSLAGIPVLGGTGLLSITGSRIESSDLRIDSTPGMVCLHGWLDTEKREMNISTRTCFLDSEKLIGSLELRRGDLDLKQVLTRMNLKELKGEGALHGVISGTFDDPRFSGGLEIPRGFFMNEPLTLASSFSVTGSLLDLQRFDLSLGDRRYGAKGLVRFKPEMDLNLSMDFEQGRISDILALTPWKDLPVEGELHGTLAMKGNLDRPFLDGTVIARRGRVFGKPFQEAQIDLRSTADVLSLESFRIALARGSITGKGSLSEKGALDFVLSGTAIPLEELQFLLPPTAQVKGDVNLDVRLGGTRASPEGTFTFLSEPFSLNDYAFARAQGTARWEKGELRLTPFTLDDGAGRYELRGAFTFPGAGIPVTWQDWSTGEGRPSFSLEVSAQNGGFSRILGVLRHPWKDIINGTLTGMMSLEGQFPSPSGRAEMLLTDVKVGDKPFDTVVLKGRYGAGEVDLDEFSFSSKEASGLLTGSILEKGECDLTAKIRSFPVAAVRPFTNWRFPIGGSFDLDAHITGAITAPDMRSTFELRHGFLSNFNVDSFHGSVNAEGGIFTLDGVELQVGRHKTRVEGTVPLAWSDGHIVSSAPMRVNASLSESSLDFLSLFTPYISSSEGKIKGNLGIRGSLPNPRIFGRISVRQGNVKLKPMRNAIDNLNMDVHFRGNMVDFERFDGRLGQGKFTLARKDPAKPTVSLDGLSISEMNMNFKGDDLLFLIPGYFDGKLNLNVFLTKAVDAKYPSIYNLDASGFTIRDATITFPVQEFTKLAEEQEGKGSLVSLPKVDVNLEFNMENNVWIRLFNSTIASKGYPNLRGVFPDLVLQGDIHLSKGTFSLPFFTAPFQLNKGTAYFSKERPWDPYLDLEAETDISGYRIFFGFLGYREKNEFTYIVSDPPGLSKDQLRALLTGQVPAAGQQTPVYYEAVPFERRAVNDLIREIALQPITQILGKAFKLNAVTLEYTGIGGYSLRIAKALDPDEKFFITFTRIITPQNVESRLWGLEYRFRRGMLLRVSQDDQGQNYFFYQAVYELGKSSASSPKK